MKDSYLWRDSLGAMELRSFAEAQWCFYSNQLVQAQIALNRGDSSKAIETLQAAGI